MLAEIYQGLDDWLVDQESDIRASEIQGLFAGLLATSQSPLVEQEFAARLLEYADLQPSALRSVSKELETIVTTLKSSWSGLGLEFELLLPTDDAFIDERVEALGAWCEAFLSGVGLSGGLTSGQAMSEDVRQALFDLSEIARIEMDEDDGSLEHAFLDVCEHVRLSALVIATEYGLRPDTSPSTDSMH